MRRHLSELQESHSRLRVKRALLAVHRSGGTPPVAQNGALVCAACGGFVVVGERGPLPLFCSGACRTAVWRARRTAAVDAPPQGGGPPAPGRAAGHGRRKRGGKGRGRGR